MQVMRLLGAIVPIFFLAGCSSGELFDDLDEPTPNVLRGVFQTSGTDGNFDIDVRLRFDDDVLTGAAKCRPRNPKFKEMDLEGEVPLEVSDLDAAEGEFTIPTLSMSADQGELICEAGLRAGTYSYKVEDRKLTLRNKDVAIDLIYGKVGD